MTAFFDVPQSILNQLLLVVILNLIPLLVWAAWELDQHRQSWLSRRQARDPTGRRNPSNI